MDSGRSSVEEELMEAVGVLVVVGLLVWLGRAFWREMTEEEAEEWRRLWDSGEGE